MDLSTPESTRLELSKWLEESQTPQEDVSYGYFFENIRDLYPAEETLLPLFEAAAKFQLFDELRSYVRKQFDWIKKNEFDGAYYDEETPYGSFAVELLIEHCEENLDLYLEYLSINDPMHEVRQSDAIRKLFDKYGLTDSTYPILEYRLCVGRGQHGGSDFRHIAESHDLLSWLKENDKLDRIKMVLIEYYRQIDNIKIGADLLDKELNLICRNSQNDYDMLSGEMKTLLQKRYETHILKSWI